MFAASHLRKISAVIALTFLLTVYIRQPPPTTKPSHYGGGNPVKNVVAYSLKKRMQLEGEELECDGGGGADYSSVASGPWSRVAGTGFYFFSAHEDARLAPYYYIRILGMAKGKWSESLFCHFVSPEGIIRVTRGIPTTIWAITWIDDHEEENFTPQLISCQLPTNQNTPTKLYLNNSPCSNNSTLIYSSSFKSMHQQNNNEVAVCVKPINFQSDISRRLIEWIEFNKIVGASVIYLYVQKIHRNVKKVLKYYEKVVGSRVKIIQVNSNVFNNNELWQKRKNEILIYNDCFYKNIHTSDYILPVDIDELIVPKIGPTWQDLFKTFPPHYASYTIRNTYFLLNSQTVSYFKVFKRTKFSDSGESGKSFVSTKNALTVFNHYALHALKPGISRCYFVPEDLAQMNHYRNSCNLELLPECIKYLSSPRIYDDIILKYNDVFEKNVKGVLHYINLK